MSRIGKKPIELPKGVEVTIDGSTVTVKGPKGTLSRTLRPEVAVAQEGSNVVVTRKDDSRQARSLHGLSRTLVSNMVEGVSKGFTKTLEVVGVGYRFQMQGNKLGISAGFSHPVEFTPPEGLSFQVEGQNKLHISGIDKQLVGDLAAEIRSVRPPEPYKGKGIKYAGEVVRRKAGKTGGKKK